MFSNVYILEYLFLLMLVFLILSNVEYIFGHIFILETVALRYLSLQFCFLLLISAELTVILSDQCVMLCIVVLT
jgi:hypothetical protein